MRQQRSRPLIILSPGNFPNRLGPHSTDGSDGALAPVGFAAQSPCRRAQFASGSSTLPRFHGLFAPQIASSRGYLSIAWEDASQRGRPSTNQTGQTHRRCSICTAQARITSNPRGQYGSERWHESQLSVPSPPIASSTSVVLVLLVLLLDQHGLSLLCSPDSSSSAVLYSA